MRKKASQPRLLGFAAQRAKPRPPCTGAHVRSPRASLARRPRSRTRLPRSQPLPAGPRMLAAPPVYCVVFLTHASTAYATGARQLWQGQARGSCPGHDPVPLRRAHATPHHHLMRCIRLHRTMPSALGGMALGYKASPHAAHARCPSFSLSLRRCLVAQQPHHIEIRGPRRRS